jgi:hypothetical protein
MPNLVIAYSLIAILLTAYIVRIVIRTRAIDRALQAEG